MSAQDIKQLIENASEYIPEEEREVPIPLIRPLPPSQEFPIHAIGELGEAAIAIQDMTQAPLGLCAQSVLAAASLVFQAHADVLLPTGEQRPISEFFVTIGVSGERKSSCDGRALEAITDYENHLRENYDFELVNWCNTKAAWDAERARILRGKGTSYPEKKTILDELGSPPEAPLTPLIVCPEPTYEGLVKLLITGQPSVGIFSDEGASFIGGYGMSKDNRLSMGANLSHGWDGKPIKRVRSGDGVSVLYGRRITFHLMVQPMAASLLLCDDQLEDQGLLSRLLVSAPSSTMGTRFWKEPSPDSQMNLKRYRQRLLAALKAPAQMQLGKKNELSPKVIRFSDAAKAIWVKFADKVESLMIEEDGYAMIRGLANKLPQHAARLAVVVMLYEDATQDELQECYIQAGIELAEYYANESLRLISAGLLDKNKTNAQKLLDWLGEWKEPVISLPDMYQLGPSEFRDLESIKRLVDILEDHGWLEYLEGGGMVNGKMRKEVWKIRRLKH